MRKIAGLLLLFLLLGSLFAAGQTPAPAKVPKFLWIMTEQFKADRMVPYTKMNKTFKDLMAQTDIRWLAETAIAGNGNEYTFVCFLDSAAAVDKALTEFIKAGTEMGVKHAALNAEGMASVIGNRSVLAKLEPDLSVSPEKVDQPFVTRVRVVSYQLKPGTAPEFTDLLKEIQDLHAKANDNVHTLVYRIVAGDPNPSFIVVVPMRGMADMDEENPAYMALMTPVMLKHITGVIKETVVNMQTGIYAIDPALSRPPESFLAANPGFWVVKEPEPVVAQTGKKAKKTVEPAAMKQTEKK